MGSGRPTGVCRIQDQGVGWNHPVILKPKVWRLVIWMGQNIFEAFYWDPVAGIDLGWGMKIVHYKNSLSTYQLKNNQCHRALCCGHKSQVHEVMTIIEGKTARGLSLVWSLFKSNWVFPYDACLMVPLRSWGILPNGWRFAILQGPNDQYLSPFTFTRGSLRCHLFVWFDFKQANKENAWHMCDTRHLGLPMFFFAFQVFSF